MALRLVVMLTAHVPVPEHAPLQPEKYDPAGATGVSVVEPPPVMEAEQTPPPPQLIPPEELVTLPVPETSTANIGVVGSVSAVRNCAMTGAISRMRRELFDASGKLSAMPIGLPL